MGAPARCPYCGTVREGAGTARPLSAGQALEGLYHEVELIRKMAETSARQSDEIRMLRETIARLRGTTRPQSHAALAEEPAARPEGRTRVTDGRARFPDSRADGKAHEAHGAPAA